MKLILFLTLLRLTSAQAATPDIVVYSGVPCGIAASITAAQDSPELIRLK